ncbi:uncharacterized protein LOC128739442 [Sabethes cyaneus]|uniref:uncharacterized protein LOC128739442 n=1 Tax=Sabethes cyaneus TaxID=53552 RepID=UPI00237DDD7D|nr:uncharacterized protein LOC128739442 [Sabethes cyaneus]
MTADIEKMYRQIMVHQDDRQFQQTLWRNDASEPLKAFQLNIITYGTSCAPFLATRVLNQLADDDGKEYPLASQAVKRDFYVDDLLTGANSIEDTKEIARQLIELLDGAGFSLRKWSSNDTACIMDIPEERWERQPQLELDRSPSIKTLGLLWFPTADVLGFKIPQLFTIEKVTKRVVLSEISQLFDPLGLVGPIVISAKMFIQRLWLEELQWDDELPDELRSWWLSFRVSIDVLQEIRVPRWVLGTGITDYQLHCFVDASEKGYGACLYVVASDSNGPQFSNLLIAKSRVSPKSGETMPWLELCAARLGSQLIDTILQTTTFAGTPILWSDSTIVLHWIRSPPSKWKIFVSNRIAEIHRLTQDSQWRYVPTALNPADCLSRGLQPDELQHNTLWWHGPPFLLLDREHWPKQTATLSSMASEQLTLERKATTVLAAFTTDQCLIERFSDLARLLKVTSYCRRFLRNCKSNTENRLTGALSPNEYDEALKSLVRVVQRASFPSEIHYLEGKGHGETSLKKANLKSPLNSYDLMLDPQGTLRIQGRLANLSGSFDTRFPMVLPYDHHFSRLIARSIHHQTLHTGPAQLLSIIRQRFWPVRGRELARRTVHQCLTCSRCRPHPCDQYMAPLPAARITPSKVFEQTGLDYCGPFLVRPLAGRGASVKVWVAVYVCFAVKAVALDIVDGLPAAACVNSLRRFVSRVGRVRIIHCDNSISFVGAARELREMRRQYREQFATTSWANECLQRGIEFQFIPPRAPHFGGLWEAAVKKFKYHLIRIMKTTPYRLDDFRTAIAQAESIMNSRPLTPLSNDPSDLSVLTPGHFLIRVSSFQLPEQDYQQKPLNRLSRFQATQRAITDL